MVGGQHAGQVVHELLETGDVRALKLARKRFIKAHGTVFKVLGIMQWYWYSSDRRRERFVKISIAMLVVVQWRNSRKASLLLTPYLAWVTFAAILKWATVRLNGPF